MNKRVLERLLLIAAVGLGVAGLIFLGLTLFAKERGLLWPGLLCISLANIFNLIRHEFKQKGE